MRWAIIFVLTLLVSVHGQEDCYEWGVEYHGGGLEDPLVTGVTSPGQCQTLCQQRSGCQNWAWVNSQHDVVSYQNTCWLKGENFNKQPCATCVSGPRTCQGGPETECCTRVTVSSTGDTPDYQWVRLGVFNWVYNSPDGRPVYYMTKHDQYLYFADYPGVWYVNDEPLVNMGGIINWDQAVCPENIVQPWSFYRSRWIHQHALR